MADADGYYADYQAPLDVTKFPEAQQQAIVELTAIVEKLNPEDVERLAAVVKKMPSSHIEDELHFRAPAYYSFLAFGTAGIEALYRLSIDPSQNPILTSAQAILSAAVGDTRAIQMSLILSHKYLPRRVYERLRDTAMRYAQDPAIQAEARRAVARVIRHYAADPANRGDLGMILMAVGFDAPKGSPQYNLIANILATATLSISDELCDEASELIAQDLNEAEYQTFFENNPALLDPLAASIVPRQALAEQWRTDFVIRRFDDQYVFVELEKPRDPLFTTYPQPSSSLSHALGQVLSWFAWVEDNIAYAQTHGFPKIRLPRGLVVIGRDAQLNQEQKRMLGLINDLLGHRILIWTYDDVIRNAHNVVRNLTSRSAGA